MKLEFKKQKAIINDFILDELLYQPNICGEIPIVGRPSFKFFVAGGAITSALTEQEINDYDIYFYNEDDYNLFVKHICVDNATLINDSELAQTWNRGGQTFQTIKIFGTPAEVFEYFDYTINMAALVYGIDIDHNYDTEDFVLHERFFDDIMSRRLIFNIKTKFPINSLFRLKKYESRGYKINKCELLKVALAISKLDIKILSQLKPALLGVSSSVSNKLVAAIDLEIEKSGDVEIDVLEWVCNNVDDIKDED